MGEKERKTHIVRVYGEDDSEEYWIDLEVIDQATFGGAQFPGLYHGNQPLETTLRLHPGPDREGVELIKIKMIPDSDKYAVEVPVVAAMTFSAKGNERLGRSFDNTPPTGKTPPSRDYKWRIASNGIDEEFLKDDKGRGPGKQPPSDPKEYLEAVRQSDDEALLFLDVCIPRYWTMKRGGTTQYQSIDFFNLWGSRKIKMPGVEASPADAKNPAVVVDPYQAIINFGPDSLAVEFSGSAAGGEDPNKPKPPPPDGAPSPPGSGTGTPPPSGGIGHA